MKWISVDDLLPSESLEGAPNVLITDGEQVSIGWREEEYFAESKEDPCQYRSEVWHDLGNLLETDYSGWPEVTHWMPLPEAPYDKGC